MSPFSQGCMCLAAAAALAGPPAMASAAEHRETQVVPYGDLDLRTDTGGRELLSRVRVASRQVCRGLLDARRIDARARYITCVADTYEEAARNANRIVVVHQQGQRPQSVTVITRR